MSNTPHTLGEEFPDQIEAIHALKTSNPAFAKLLVEYDEINDKVHRAKKSRIDVVTEEAETEMRKARLAIKDAIAAALAQA